MLRFPLVVAKTANRSLRKGRKNQERTEKNAKHVQLMQCSIRKGAALN